MKLFGSFLSSKGETEKSSLAWESLTEEQQVNSILETSLKTPVMIYKHSTRCGISSMVLNRIEREYVPGEMDIRWYFLDLIRYRRISDLIATTFGVRHESPQVLLIKDGRVIYHASHGAINMAELRSRLV